MKIIKGKQKAPWKICLYGVQGIGKTTIASLAPKPLMIDLENGLTRIDADKTPLITEYSNVDLEKPGLRQAIHYAITAEYETVVFDTVDGIERILTAEILKDDGTGKTDLADFGYGRGYEALERRWSDFFDGCDELVALGLNILFVAHDKVEKVESPTSDNYDRYGLRLNKRTAPIVLDRCDAVLFARYETFLKGKGEKSFTGIEKKRAVGTGRRVLECCERPAWLAKNRFGMPDQVSFDNEIYKWFE